MERIKQVKDHLNKFGFIKMPLYGNSMSPLIKNGDTIIVKKVSVESLKKWDIVLFVIGDELVTHYINKINLNESTVITKGLGVDHLDPCIKIDNILGYVDIKIPMLLKVKEYILGKLRRD
tara:strand:- start:128679 stop:129038 length:360 start_codon:yes stop_codon:yes gene_type:complete